MNGKINFINDVAETFGDSRENIESYLESGNRMRSNRAVVFNYHNGYGYFVFKEKDNMIGVVKSPEKLDMYKWEVRKEAA